MRPVTAGFGLRAGVTYRRWLIDEFLASESDFVAGVVVDVGGKNARRRGSFRPPQGGERWLALNVDEGAEPDVVGDAHGLPFASRSVDWVLCCEVLEHLPRPIDACSEIKRVLKEGGSAIITVPFLFPRHGDPDDYWRLTPAAVRQLFPGWDLRVVAMGRSMGTIGMLLELATRRVPHTSGRRVFNRVVTLVGRALSAFEIRRNGGFGVDGERLTTGYACVVHGPAGPLAHV